jgi:hypothetical protein
MEVGLKRKHESIPSFFETTQMLILMRIRVGLHYTLKLSGIWKKDRSREK